jgi:hypothetical protein
MRGLKVKAVRCRSCGRTIYSRSVHDFHWCDCKKVAVDGGRDYLKVTGEPEDYEVVDVLLYGVTQKMLEEDWNSGGGEYGQTSKIQ